jgi:hypothetical protein
MLFIRRVTPATSMNSGIAQIVPQVFFGHQKHSAKPKWGGTSVNQPHRRGAAIQLL